MLWDADEGPRAVEDSGSGLTGWELFEGSFGDLDVAEGF